MFSKKKFLLLTLILIIISQIILLKNNNQKAQFRYFKWKTQEVSVGKLISISFFSGLFITTLINIRNNKLKKNIFEDIEENYDPLNNKEGMKSNIDIPPQRDIRDSQPTISVNYRVVKNTEENILRREQNYSNSNKNMDDWDNDDNDW